MPQRQTALSLKELEEIIINALSTESCSGGPLSIGCALNEVGLIFKEDEANRLKAKVILIRVLILGRNESKIIAYCCLAEAPELTTDLTRALLEQFKKYNPGLAEIGDKMIKQFAEQNS